MSEYAPDARVPEDWPPDEAAPHSQEAKPMARRITAGDVVTWVQDRYRLGATPAGEAFALPLGGPQLPVMLEGKGGRLRDTVTAELYDVHGVVAPSKTVDDAMRVVIARCRQLTQRQVLHLRVAAHADGLVIDLGHPGLARCVVVTAHGWILSEDPPPGVLFRRTAATRPLPEPASEGDLDALRRLLSLDVDDHRWALVRGWLVAVCFPTIPRPVLLALGAPGSAKTTRARLTVSVLDPRDELGSSFGKNLTDDQTKALGRYLVSYDNLVSVSEAVSDHLCRLVTGDEIDKRVLYSDNELSTVSYRRTGALTAVTMPALRADALERVVVLAVDRIPEAERRGEKELRASFTEQHPAILAGLLDDLAAALRGLPAARAWEGARPRMADYFDVLLALDPALAAAYRDGAEGVMQEAAESDPFVAAVTSWLAEQQMPWVGETTQAWRAASVHRETLDGFGASSAPWWPRDATRFAAALTNATEPLRSVGYEVRRRKRNGRRTLEFSAVPTRSPEAFSDHLQDRDAEGRCAPVSVPSVPSVPAISAGQSEIGPDRDARDAGPGGFSTPDLEGGRGGRAVGDVVREVPANSVPSVPASVWADGTPVPQEPPPVDDWVPAPDHERHPRGGNAA